MFENVLKKIQELKIVNETPLLSYLKSDVGVRRELAIIKRNIISNYNIGLDNVGTPIQLELEDGSYSHTYKTEGILDGNRIGKRYQVKNTGKFRERLSYNLFKRDDGTIYVDVVDFKFGYDGENPPNRDYFRFQDINIVVFPDNNMIDIPDKFLTGLKKAIASAINKRNKQILNK